MALVRRMDIAEILTGIRVPAPMEKTTTAFLKMDEVSMDIAVVNAADRITFVIANSDYPIENLPPKSHWEQHIPSLNQVHGHE